MISELTTEEVIYLVSILSRYVEILKKAGTDRNENSSVCDDALVYEQMKNIIASYSIVKNENLELTFYQTVEELLHAKHKYDILFLDIRFNNCDIGIDVAKKLRKAGNTSLIILLTSLHAQLQEIISLWHKIPGEARGSAYVMIKGMLIAAQQLPQK